MSKAVYRGYTCLKPLKLLRVVSRPAANKSPLCLSRGRLARELAISGLLMAPTGCLIVFDADNTVNAVLNHDGQMGSK